MHKHPTTTIIAWASTYFKLINVIVESNYYASITIEILTQSFYNSVFKKYSGNAS